MSNESRHIFFRYGENLDWAYEETTSGRNYRNRWRGCFEREEKKIVFVQIFFRSASEVTRP